MASYTKIPANNKQGYKWICTIEGPPDPTTGKRNQIPRRADTQKEALARAQAVYNERKLGIDSKKTKKITIIDVAEEWLKTYSKGKVKRRSVVQRGVQINNLNNYFKKKPISKITHRDYQNFLNDLDDQEYAHNTMLGINNTANMIFKYAIKHKIRIDNPTIDAVIPQKVTTVEEIENKDQLIEDKYLNRSELLDFFSTINEHGELQDKEIFYLLAFSGVRSGELCALKWTDIDFVSNQIRITKTMDSDNMRNYQLETPKTTGSIRLVPIDENVMIMLMEHKERQATQMKSQRDYFKDYHDKKFVFRNNDGYPFNAQHIRIRMQRIIKDTSITKHATPHIFRHTFVSMLAEAEVDLNTIMQRVGHENEKTTLNIYTHVTQKMQKNADLKIKNHYADVLNLSTLQDM
ncbi:tyrosine-type recombinase/integrase [Paenibacillus glacialis]|uniref:Integrase n=1 Tax=Paenibacillus glacialis TaxID=494026 RepID=A0A168DG58_9BACL|nr:site-specific integrase [Paenibacillus glacialis]OAB34168.1 integrase [Paenibacillus glacialis]